MGNTDRIGCHDCSFKPSYTYGTLFHGKGLPCGDCHCLVIIIRHPVLSKVVNGAERRGTTHNPRLLLGVGVVPNTADGVWAETNNIARRDLVTGPLNFHNPTVESNIHFFLLFVGVWSCRLPGRKRHCIDSHLGTAKRFGKFSMTVPRFGELLLCNFV